MKFSIPKLIKDVKDYEETRDKLNKMKNPRWLWSKRYSKSEIDIVYQEYIYKMKKLEENYNINYNNNLRKKCFYNNSPVKMLPSAPPADMIC